MRFRVILVSCLMMPNDMIPICVAMISHLLLFCTWSDEGSSILYGIEMCGHRFHIFAHVVPRI